jgi:lipoate-protein ligase B
LGDGGGGAASAEPFDVRDLGLIDYEAAWKLQEDYAGEIATGQRPPTLLLLEHPHVFTFGRKGRPENLLWTQAQQSERGVAVHWVDRGGDVTYHGPGQLVGYPLLPLGKLAMMPPSHGEANTSGRGIPPADYVGYVRKLENVLIAALAHLGVVSGQVPGLTGVWVPADVFSRCLRCRSEDRHKPAKIAAIGVKVDAHGISRHGFALNVDPDMTYWEGIIACGIPDHPVTSIAELLAQVPPMRTVKAAIVAAFCETFGGTLRPREARPRPPE